LTADKLRLLKDWEVVLVLNDVLEQVNVKEEEVSPLASGELVEESQQRALQFVQANMSQLELPFQVPTVDLLGTLWH
jgi:hypothetical protein